MNSKMNNNGDIASDLLEIKTMLNNILHNQHNIEQRLLNLESKANRMDHHISFIEKIYNTLRYPLEFITGKSIPVNDVKLIE